MKLYSFVTRRGFQTVLRFQWLCLLHRIVQIAVHLGSYTHRVDFTSSVPIASAFRFKIASGNRGAENPEAKLHDLNHRLLLPAKEAEVRRRTRSRRSTLGEIAPYVYV